MISGSPVSGIPVSGRKVPRVASGGAYTLTGLSGTYSYAGASATLLRSRLIVADPGAYTYTGASVTLLKSKVIEALSGSYIYTGQTAEFTYSGAPPAISEDAYIIRARRRGRR